MTVGKTRAARAAERRPFLVPFFRELASLAIGAALITSTTGIALASGDEGEGGHSESPSPSQRAASLAPSDNPDAIRKAYLTLLFQEINVRRDRAAAPRYEYMADSGNEAVNAYLRDLLPAMLQEHGCFHGSSHPGMRAGWDYLDDVGMNDAKVGGEVLACPDVQEGAFWTPSGIATGWWNSPSHWKTLYGDVQVRGVACGADEPIKNGMAYETVACLTLKGRNEPG